MDRVIKFRGRTLPFKEDTYEYTGEWKFGSLVVRKDGKYYITDGTIHPGSEIIPSSVGQFTRLVDKNGIEIYEGDKFKPDTDNEEVKSVLRWDVNNAKFIVDSYSYDVHIGEGSQEVYDNELSVVDSCDIADMIIEYLEVIGNIHEESEVHNG